MEEYFFQCPHCWQEISVLIDLSVTEQQYIEDCEVCCNPIQFEITTDGENVVEFKISSLEQ
ncbi:CPXCG motif-containing cysteine-rich protein [Aegicerativicinus sediminis]|uniref:CPXCG motif-containing cysteine-rich protein n=1 Tax=Aegicerativicinus sediminis TaxID=2893202 RepID=UPI001E520BBF|nr:CPXCG motif-containing cysteine-rich protein [Aegicerativicinus sediminis]